MEENKPAFEARFVPSPAMYREYVWRMTSPLLYLFMIAAEAYMIYLCYRMHQNQVLWERPIVLIGAAYFLLWPLLRQELSARRNITHLKKACGGQLPEVVISFGDAIEIRESESHYSAFQYAQIVRFVRMKHCCALMLDNKLGLLFDPNGFTVGSAEQLPAFLQEKCPNIRIKK